MAPPEEPKAQGEALSAAEIDAIIDRVIDYHPEEQIAALTEATEELVAGVVADAEAKGQTVRVIRNIPAAKKARKPKAAARARKSRP